MNNIKFYRKNKIIWLVLERIKLKVVIKLRRNKSLVVIIMLMITILLGCSQIEKKDDVAINLFDMKKADDIVKEYLNNIVSGDLESANSLLSEELLTSNKNSGEGVSKIISFKPDQSIEGSNYAYFIYNIVRSSDIEPKSDLENITFKIRKQNKEYKIDEVKSKSEKEIYIKGSGLRIIGEEGGKSSLVINLNTLPQDTYLRDNKIMLYKDVVPKDSFGKVCLSFTGNRVAITTTNNKDSYICIAYIDEALMSSAQPGGDGGNSEASLGTGNIDSLEDVLEKPIAQKLVTVDLLKGSKVTKFIFSPEEDILQVSYNNEYNKERIKLYKSDDGSLIQTELDTMFPQDKYNISNGKFEEDVFKFKVTASDGEENTNGNYILDLKNLDINKL